MNISNNLYQLISILLCIMFCFSESDAKTTISFKDGLANDFVTCITHDENNVAWIGTRDGLSKYDGNTIVNFWHDPNNKNSLSNDTINALYYDDTGYLWIGTQNGLNLMDIYSEIFVLFENSQDDQNSISSNSVTAICKDRDAHIWVGTRQRGINKIKFNNNTYDKSNPANKKYFTDLHISSIAEDQAGSIWIGTNYGLINIDKDPNGVEQIQYFLHDENNQNSPAGSGVTCLYIDIFDDLWIGYTNGMLDKYNITQKKYSHYQLNNNSGDFDCPVSNITDYGNTPIFLVVAKKNGYFNILNKETNSFLINQDLSQPGNKYITDLCTDHNGNLWYGTWGNGISIEKNYHEYQKNTLHACYKQGDTSVISQINCLYMENNSQNKVRWMGTRGGGLLMTDKLTQKFTQYKYDDDQNTSKLNNIYQINKLIKANGDKDHILWLTTEDSGLLWFDSKRKKYLDTHANQEPLLKEVRDRVSYVHISQNKLNSPVLLGTHNDGLYFYHFDTQKLQHLISSTENKSSLLSNKIKYIYEDRHNNYWIFYFSCGISLIDVHGKIIKHFPVTSGKNIPLFTLGVSSATSQMKVIYFKNGQKYEIPINYFVEWYYDNKSMSFDKVMQIWEYPDLSKSPSPLPEIQIFESYESDLLDNIFMAYKQEMKLNPLNLTHKYLLGLAMNNKNDFIIRSYENYKNRVRPVIQDLKIGYQSLKNMNPDYYKNVIKNRKNVELSYNQNSIQIDLSLINYLNTSYKNAFYRLMGIDEDWQRINSNHITAQYSALPVGQYAFQVKGRDLFGIKRELLSISILPPFWMTSGAYAIYGLLILFSIGLVWRLHIKKIKFKHQLEIDDLEREQLKEVNQLKSKLLADISHEFRAPLTLIREPLKEILSDEFTSNFKETCRKILFNTEQVLSLVNQLLDLSKLDAKQMKIYVSEIELNKFLRIKIAQFESLAKQKNIDLKFSSFSPEIYLWVDVDKFTTIINNLLSNAMKFTPNNEHIDVRVTANTNTFIDIAVSNTGIAVQPTNIKQIFNRFYQIDGLKEGTGIGLSLVKELTELHKGAVDVLSENDDKITFIVRLPLGTAHFDANFIISESTYTSDQIKEEYVKGLPEVILNHLNERILIVDDHDEMREYIVSIFNKQYHVIEAKNGVEALAKVQNTHPDLIICDVKMPEMDGFALCREIKSNEETSHIPFILLTGRVEDNDKVMGLEFGADDYLTKPFNKIEIVTRVNNIFKQRDRLRQKFADGILVLPKNIAISSYDKKILTQLLQIVQDNMANEEFNVHKLCDLMSISYTSIVRKLKSLTGMTPVEFLRLQRLLTAKELIDQGYDNISQVALKVGFKNLSYFSALFKIQFGISPSSYSKNIQG